MAGDFGVYGDFGLGWLQPHFSCIYVALMTVLVALQRSSEDFINMSTTGNHQGISSESWSAPGTGTGIGRNSNSTIRGQISVPLKMGGRSSSTTKRASRSEEYDSVELVETGKIGGDSY